MIYDMPTGGRRRTRAMKNAAAVMSLANAHMVEIESGTLDARRLPYMLHEQAQMIAQLAAFVDALQSAAPGKPTHLSIRETKGGTDGGGES